MGWASAWRRGFSTVSDDINNPVPFRFGSGPRAGQITKYPLSGDPVNDRTGLLGDVEDTVAILAIVLLNALLGFRQEYRAEKAMAALKKLAVPVVKVRREGRVFELPATHLVPMLASPR